MKHLDAHRHPVLVKLAHHGHMAAHVVYLGLVSVEAHGTYGLAAAAVLFFLMLQEVLGLPGAE